MGNDHQRHPAVFYVFAEQIGHVVSADDVRYLRERERQHIHLHVSASYMGRQFPGEQPGIRSGQIDVAVPVGHDGSDALFPSVDVLYFVDEDVRAAFCIAASDQIAVQGVRIADSGGGTGFQVEIDYIAGASAHGLEDISELFHDGCFAGSPHPHEHFDDVGINERSDSCQQLFPFVFHGSASGIGMGLRYLISIVI